MSVTPVTTPRRVCVTTRQAAIDMGVDPVAAGVLAARVHGDAEFLDPIVNPSLVHLHPPTQLRDASAGARRLARALAGGEAIGIATDYDVDGITSHALITEALMRFGAPASSLRHYIGHRINDGYGLSDNLADVILAERPPPVLITADCGSSDHPRIERLAAAGVDVIVTDHHALPAAGPPAAAFATINPTRPDCAYPDPAIAGCMVSWLLMCELRRCLLENGQLAAGAPKLAHLLDYVSLGTVADAVSLSSPANRAVVNAGLAVINRFERPCWRAMRALIDRPGLFSTDDLGFQIGPRINARGRMDEPHAALDFLRASADDEAIGRLRVLDANNLDRRAAEKTMVSHARGAVAGALQPETQVVVVFDPSFHPGVQGIVASRLVEAFGRPAIVFSPSRDERHVSGSMRSVPGVHARQALQRAADAAPGLFAAFGGHEGAAGLTLRRDGLAEFERLIAAAVYDQIGDRRLRPVLLTDGVLPPAALNAATWETLQRLEPFGRGFEAPVWQGRFAVQQVRPVGADRTHLKLTLADAAGRYDAIWFSARRSDAESLPVIEGMRMDCAYRLDMNEFRGNRTLQLIIRHGLAIE